MKTILFIHQSADLYGSDKTLLYLVDKIRPDYKAIVVVPCEGELTTILREKKIQVIINPVIKISRGLFNPKGLLTLPFIINKAVKQLKKQLKNEKIAIIHSNTLAVLLGGFYSKKHKIKHIWHVHEIIKKPKIVAKAFPIIVNYFSDIVVFNSKASYEHLTKGKKQLKAKSQIILNGIDRNTTYTNIETITKIRKSFFSDSTKETIILGLVGRISKHKGQQLLLNAFEELSKEHPSIKLVFIGATIESQKYLLVDLKNAIKHKNLIEKVSIVPFQKNIWQYYDSLDIVIVPTTDPEPFGLVALEGMLAQKPVIAANHGGLKEIITHNETGLLFEPNNEKDLAIKIESILANTEKYKSIAQAGEKHAKTAFSLRNYIEAFKKLYHEVK